MKASSTISETEFLALKPQLLDDSFTQARQFFFEKAAHDIGKTFKDHPLATLAHHVGNGVAPIPGPFEDVQFQTGPLDEAVQEFCRLTDHYVQRVREPMANVREKLPEIFPVEAERKEAETHLQVLEAFRDRLRDTAAEIAPGKGMRQEV